MYDALIMIYVGLFSVVVLNLWFPKIHCAKFVLLYARQYSYGEIVQLNSILTRKCRIIIPKMLILLSNQPQFLV